MYEVAFAIKFKGFWSLFFVPPGFLFCVQRMSLNISNTNKYQEAISTCTI